MWKKCMKLLAVLLAASLALAACGSGQNGAPDDAQPPQENGPEPYTLTARVCGPQDTLDPARSTAPGGETVLYHLFENLMRWEDDGSGWATVAPGQAESYTLETDYAGNATYTFTLREGILWSDGKAVSAADFVTAWRRLADPANGLPHRQLMEAVSGYSQVQETGDPSLLAVSAPDERTFVVALDGSRAYFLEEVCASAYTMPTRADLIANGAWGSSAAATVTNGAYTATHLSRNLVTLERSGTYYGCSAKGPDLIQFESQGEAGEDYGKFLDGELDLLADRKSVV